MTGRIPPCPGDRTRHGIFCAKFFSLMAFEAYLDSNLELASAVLPRLGARFFGLSGPRSEAANLVANPSFNSPTYRSGAGNKMCRFRGPRSTGGPESSRYRNQGSKRLTLLSILRSNHRHTGQELATRCAVSAVLARLGARFFALLEPGFEAANRQSSFKSPTYWSGAGNKMC